MGFVALGVASVLMLAAFMLGLHVASTLGVLSFSLMYFFGDRPLWEMLGLIAWNTNTSFVIVIPPSISFIVYGVLMEVSIGRLYMAGVIPGIMLSLLFMGVIFVAALIWPHLAPREPAAPLRELLASLVDMLPTLFLIFLVLGTIYLGVATPTEAAAFGVVGAFVLAAGARPIHRPMVKAVCI